MPANVEYLEDIEFQKGRAFSPAVITDSHFARPGIMIEIKAVAML